MYGPHLQQINQPVYMKPYPNYIGRDYLFAQVYKILEFSLFSGDRKVSAIKLVAQFTFQCGKCQGDDFLKLRFFPSSLTRRTFNWYINLHQNSIFTCWDTQNAFQDQFARRDPKTTMADLARVRQKLGETTEEFLTHFRKAPIKC